MRDLELAVLWQAIWLAAAAATVPWLRWLHLPARPAHGIALAAGPALVVLPLWWVGMLSGIPFTRVTLFLVSSLLALVSAGLIIARGQSWQSLTEIVTAWPLLLVHTGAFALYALFRSYNPAIRYTEKPMELAFLSAAWANPHLPPPDPWFAGRPINYYTFGYVEFGAIAKTLGCQPEFAFNLALASLFASAVTAAYVATWLLATRYGAKARVLAGVLALFLLVGIGNWQTAWLLLQDPRGALAASWWAGPGWQASRVIVDSGFPWDSTPRPTINEFPSFSFVLGDLHPHILSLPLYLSFLIVLIALAQAARVPEPLTPPIDKSTCHRSQAHVGRERWTFPLLAGIFLGCLWITNTWGVPLATVTAGLILLARPRSSIRMTVVQGALILSPAAFVALPFQANYVPAYGAPAEELPAFLARLPVAGWFLRTVGIVVSERSSFGELLRTHGPLLVSGLVALVATFRASDHQPVRPAVLASAVGFALVAGLASATPALVVFGLPLAGLAWVLWRERTAAPERLAALAMLAAAWSAILAVEFFYLRDVFGDRMNTVFKVYFDAWVLQAIAVPPLLLHALANWKSWGKSMAIAVVGFSLLAAAPYTPLSVWKWTDGFAQLIGLDGLAYLRQAHPDEFRAITWLRESTRPDAVVLEASGCSYGMVGALPHNRVSMATGRATILGWEGHEYQWRRGSARDLATLQKRRELLLRFFQEPGMETVPSVLSTYGISYVFVGTLERTGLGPNCPFLRSPAAEALGTVLQQIGWAPVYQDGAVTIYAPVVRR